MCRYISRKDNTSLPALTPEMQQKIMETTPGEKSGSDLTLLHPATRLSTARLPQGYTFDGTHYYFLSQLSTGSDSLRLTRITYKDDGTYDSSYMTLKDFGHGTNLDCVKKGKTTWLWTGCDSKDGESSGITCFKFQKGKTLKRHGKRHFRIPISKKGSRYATNVYPAINGNGTKLAVRYTQKNKQIFQIYKLKNGISIKPRKYIKKIRRKKTSGPFQGFDIKGSKIYTVEGTACRSEMKELGQRYYKTLIRIYDYRLKKSKKIVIKGAARLSHREPEGIQVQKDGMILINIASHYKKKYTCMNIYRVK